MMLQQTTRWLPTLIPRTVVSVPVFVMFDHVQVLSPCVVRMVTGSGLLPRVRHVWTLLQTRHTVGVTAGRGTWRTDRTIGLRVNHVSLIWCDADLQGLIILTPQCHRAHVVMLFCLHVSSTCSTRVTALLHTSLSQISDKVCCDFFLIKINNSWISNHDNDKVPGNKDPEQQLCTVSSHSLGNTLVDVVTDWHVYHACGAGWVQCGWCVSAYILHN